MKKLLKEYVPQVLLIVFSVVLGMYLNQRLVNKNEQKDANELLELVLNEIENNQKIMEEWYPYHDSIKVNFDTLKDDDDFIKAFIKDKDTLFNTLFTRGSLMQQMPSNSAWQIAKSNPLISNIDYIDMQLLADVYNVQEFMLEPAFIKLMDLHYSAGVNRPEIAKENIHIMFFYMNETVGRETYYMQLVDSALTKIGIDK